MIYLIYYLKLKHKESSDTLEFLRSRNEHEFLISYEQDWNDSLKKAIEILEINFEVKK